MKKVICLGQYLVVVVCSAILLGGCHPVEYKLKDGNWHGVFSLPNHEVPFLFEVKVSLPAAVSVQLINGSDRFEVKNVTIRQDSLFIPLDLYEQVIKAKISGDALSGFLVKLKDAKTGGGIPFSAHYGNQPRFAASGEKPLVSLQGTWDLEMGSGEQAEKTVGNFQQVEAVTTGSILTTTGDYRFLDGVITGRKFSLSAFGGSSPYLFEGEFDGENSFTGSFITPRSTTPVKGLRNDKASLPDGYEVTRLREGFKTIEFSFPNLEGKQVSLTDEVYKGKVLVVTILGSWCPNCLDENNFLAQWYKQNKQRGVEIIGLGFERKNDFEYAKKCLTNLKTRLDITYELLFAGLSGKENASRALPALNGIASFPTTIFIDKKGNVRKIHSGFNGPATGKFYETFQQEFNGFIDQLLAEK